MRLESDFRDYYDPAFDNDGPVFSRKGGNVGPAKREQFKILELAGFLTPPHGLVGEVMGMWWESEKLWVRAVVAYTDEMAHCGEGKRVYRESELKSNPDMGSPGGDRYWRERKLYCSAFVGNQKLPDYEKSLSWRRLQVGKHVFWIEYTSKESWMSNVGEGDCQVIGFEMNAGYHRKIKLPLFAVDFVLGREMYAVDFNTAPGIRGSGVEKLMTASQVVGAIKEWYADEGEGSGWSRTQVESQR